MVRVRYGHTFGGSICGGVFYSFGEARSFRGEELEFQEGEQRSVVDAFSATGEDLDIQEGELEAPGDSQSFTGESLLITNV